MFGTRLAPVGQVPSCKHRRCWMDTQGSDCMPKSVSQHQSLCCPLCLHGGQDLELHWWQFSFGNPELKGEVSPQQGRMLLSLYFHIFCSPKGEKNTSKGATGDGGLSQCLLNSWEGIIDFCVFWISPSFFRVIILSYLYIALYKPWCHFCKYPATPDFENPK